VNAVDEREDALMAVSEPLLPTTTVSFSVIQFNSSQTPFVAFANVPKAADHTYSSERQQSRGLQTLVTIDRNHWCAAIPTIRLNKNLGLG